MNPAKTGADGPYFTRLVKAGGEEWRRAEVRLGCSLALSAVVSVCDNEVFTKELIFPKYIKEREVRGDKLA